MPKEMDTGSRDLSPLRPYKKHPDLIALAVAALGFMFLLWWAGVFGADQSETEPPAPGPAVYLSPPISVEPAPPAAPSSSPPCSHRARDFRAVEYHGDRVAMDWPRRCFNYRARGVGNLCGREASPEGCPRPRSGN